MEDIAISNALSHGIYLKEGGFTATNGDCVFDATGDNLDKRNMWTISRPEKKVKEELRRLACSEIERNPMAKNLFQGSSEEFSEQLKDLKKIGVWELRIGDLVIPSLAHILAQNFIIFNEHFKVGVPITFVIASG